MIGMAWYERERHAVVKMMSERLARIVEASVSCVGLVSVPDRGLQGGSGISVVMEAGRLMNERNIAQASNIE
jgi:hypothetical protein